MPQIKKCYSLDEKIIKKIEEIADKYHWDYSTVVKIAVEGLAEKLEREVK